MEQTYIDTSSRVVRQPKAVKEQMSRKLGSAMQGRILQIGSPIGLLALWQAVVMAGLANPKFFPAPTQIVGSAIRLADSGALYLDMKASIYRILVGFLLGAIPGVMLGLSMGMVPTIRKILDPIVAATYPIPKLALLPLFMLVFGLGNLEMILVIASGAVYLALVNTAAGVLEIPKIYWDVAKDLRASWWERFRTIAVPGALPLIFSGLRLSVGMAIILIVAAESDGANHGVGYLIWRAYDIYDIKQMYVAFVLLSLMGWFFNLILDEIERRIVKWRN